MRKFLCAILAILAFIALGSLGRPLAQIARTDDNALLSAASKKKTSQSQPPGQIACTVAGCQRIPPHCHPEIGYNWNGIPTGFDIVVCRPARGRREF